ncbi:unnamed protein product, partial [Prorocentrum cordatum]
MLRSGFVVLLAPPDLHASGSLPNVGWMADEAREVASSHIPSTADVATRASIVATAASSRIGSAASSLSSQIGDAINGSYAADVYPNTKVRRIVVPRSRVMHTPRRIYIFYSDTGGGHRASALSLEAAFTRQYGDQVSVKMVDFIRDATPWPWSQLPEGYQVVGKFPTVYKGLYDLRQGCDNWRETSIFKMAWSMSRESILAFLTDLVTEGLDLVISVHPLVNHMVQEAFELIFEGRSTIPMATVVTDLGSCHLSWFDPRVDLLCVPSPQIEELALRHGFQRQGMYLCGLPVREGFWGAEPRPKSEVRRALGLDATGAAEGSLGVVLMMAGGEGFGNFLEAA